VPKFSWSGLWSRIQAVGAGGAPGPVAPAPAPAALPAAASAPSLPKRYEVSAEGLALHPLMRVEPGRFGRNVDNVFTQAATSRGRSAGAA